MIKFLFLLALMSAAVAVRADEPRRVYSFEGANGRYEIKHLSGEWAERSTLLDPPMGTPGVVKERFRIEKWSVVEKKTRKELYCIEDAGLSTKTVYLSDDGSIVVAVDDFSERIPVKDLNVLTFYERGQTLKTYKLGDLIENFESLQISVSHFRWCSGLPKQLPQADSPLSITTTESLKHLFNLRTGELVSKESLASPASPIGIRP